MVVERLSADSQISAQHRVADMGEMPMPRIIRFAQARISKWRQG